MKLLDESMGNEVMSIKSKKTPYEGLWVFLPMMILPSVAVTAVLYLAIAKWQPQYGWELNWASAKVFGCGVGILFHVSCWLLGAFAEDFRAVKTRLKEFFANLVVSPGLAFSCYWEDVKALGLAFWIDAAIIVLNACIFADALVDWLTMMGKLP